MSSHPCAKLDALVSGTNSRWCDPRSMCQQFHHLLDGTMPQRPAAHLQIKNVLIDAGCAEAVHALRRCDGVPHDVPADVAAGHGGHGLGRPLHLPGGHLFFLLLRLHSRLTRTSCSGFCATFCTRFCRGCSMSLWQVRSRAGSCNALSEPGSRPISLTDSSLVCH